MERRITLLCVMATVLAIIPSSSKAANYQVDASHTSIVFAISHLGYSYTYGRFNQVSGQFQFDANNPTTGQFTINIDPASIDTNDAKRDEHLRGADFFNVRQFPKMQFRSTQVQQGGDALELTGDFTMHGVTKRITIPLKVLGQGAGPYGKQRVGFLSQFSVKRSDFGMNGMQGPIGDEVSVLISFEGIVQ